MTIHRLISIVAVTVLVFLLVAVRFYESTLFLEPLTSYFHGDYQSQVIPSAQAHVILPVTALRFLVNSIISLAILWFLYKKVAFIKAALWVYLFAFLLLFSIMSCCLFLDGAGIKMVLFYTRRFLIHPVLLFILIAGFYYLRHKELR